MRAICAFGPSNRPELCGLGSEGERNRGEGGRGLSRLAEPGTARFASVALRPMLEEEAAGKGGKNGSRQSEEAAGDRRGEVA